MSNLEDIVINRLNEEITEDVSVKDFSLSYNNSRGEERSINGIVLIMAAVRLSQNWESLLEVCKRALSKTKLLCDLDGEFGLELIGINIIRAGAEYTVYVTYQSFKPIPEKDWNTVITRYTTQDQVAIIMQELSEWTPHNICYALDEKVDELIERKELPEKTVERVRRTIDYITRETFDKLTSYETLMNEYNK